MSKMVEIQNININDLVKVNEDTFENKIVLSPYKVENSKNLANESEMHRILMCLNKKSEVDMTEKNKSGYDIVPSFFTLDVGKNIARYDKLIDSKGILKITNFEYVLDEDGNRILDKDNHYITKKKDTKQYVSTFCGAGHSRTQKNLFVDIEVVDKLNDILLCGMPKDLIYDRPSKWNAYYAMVTTDSTALKEVPNIVVISDYKKKIRGKVDIVEVSGTGDNKKYNPIGHKGRKRCKELLEILPFDGAGLVTPECALKWAKELKCQSSKGEFYLPSCFQFRAIPGIKGEVMVFDIKRFAKEMKVSKIIDLGGREWDVFKDKIEVILTESQFKFWKQYLDKEGKFDYCLWRREFDKTCHGYKRTFNIVSYGVHPDDLSKRTMLSYQPEQTINFKDSEIPSVSKTGIDIYRKVISNVDEFLKYRTLIEESDETGENIQNIDKYTPPYYVALLHNKDLFYDKYVHEKIEADIEKLRNNILSGKLFVHRNYQVFMPDLYGLAEWAFHDELGHEPLGLLKKPYHIYSDWWNNEGASKVNMIRNPHVGMEHRICHLRNNNELKKWYKFQSTGIVTGMYDALALVLGNADFDGDCVCVFDNKEFIEAVQREFKAGNGRLVVKKELNKDDVQGVKPICISDRASLMRINQMSFKNSIGSVIDRETDLWSCINEDEERVRGYIMTGVIVGGETIDFAKTGENASFPQEIKDFLKSCKRGYWMRYLAKNRAEAIKEEKAVHKATISKKSEFEIEKLKKFIDYDCNMNRLCHYAEKQIANIDDMYLLKASDYLYRFDYRKYMLRSQPSINRKVYRMLKLLQEEYQDITQKYRKEAVKSKVHQKAASNKFRWFYNKCRTELLTLEPNIDKLIDMLVIIYYGDKKNSAEFLDLEKDILWNAFPDEMIARCSGESISNDIDYAKLEENHKKNVEYAKKQKKKKAEKKKVIIKSIEKNNQYNNNNVVITKEDRKNICELVNKAYSDKLIKRRDNVIKLKRILTMLIYLSRKCENNMITKLDNVPDEITDLTMERLTYVSHKNMDAAIAVFDKMGILESNIFRGGTKIRLLFPFHKGETWIKTDDYNKAGTIIRDYFRVDKGIGNEFRENKTKIPL